MIRQSGQLFYELSYKKVKNINLRVRPDGSVAVSAPRRTPMRELDRFVESRVPWILKAQERVAQRARAAAESAEFTDEQAYEVFSEISGRIYPMFEAALTSPPKIRVRQMKSRWGVCHPLKGYITLNKQLLSKPAEAIEYVVLHEYVHFLHPNHQKGFHAQMAALMPDYKQRKKLL